MKLLFDQNISFRIEKKLPAYFQFSKHISSVGMKNKDDVEIWKFAKDQNFTIVTFDSDFFDLSLINGTPPKIIWFRFGNLSTNEVAKILIDKHLIIRDFIDNYDKITTACLEIK